MVVADERALLKLAAIQGVLLLVLGSIHGVPDGGGVDHAAPDDHLEPAPGMRVASHNEFVPVSHTWTTNPGTPGLPWTPESVDAPEAGIVLDSTNWLVRVTQLYVTVEFGTPAAYVYNNWPTDLNGLLSVTRSTGTTSYTYDTNGNLKTKTGGWTYDWNKAGLLSKASVGGAQQQAYTYDALGRRVKVDGASPSTWTVSIYSGMEALFERGQNGVTTKYVYAAGMRIARIDCGNQIPAACTTRYYLGDHLGSTRKVMDEGEPPAVAYSAEYEPFGKPYNVQGVEGHRYTGEKHH